MNETMSVPQVESMGWPKISIVTPSFNQAEFLKATIESVLSQNYPNLEYIIIDGGSSDGSAQIIKQYESDLTYWCSEKDAGQYDAINKGFTQATGDIMAWINSDDMYFPWTFRTVASIMTEVAEVEWLTTQNLRAWDWHGYLTGFRNMPGYSREAFLDGCYLPVGKTLSSSVGWIQQESTFWKRGLWQRTGEAVRSDLYMAGDFELWSRFFEEAELTVTESPLAGFRRHEKQKTSNTDDYVAEASKVLSEIRQTVGWKPNVLRQFSTTAKLQRIPLLRRFVNERYGYKGSKLIRKQLQSPNGCWQLERYKFL